MSPLAAIYHPGGPDPNGYPVSVVDCITNWSETAGTVTQAVCVTTDGAIHTFDAGRVQVVDRAVAEAIVMAAEASEKQRAQPGPSHRPLSDPPGVVRPTRPTDPHLHRTPHSTASTARRPVGGDFRAMGATGARSDPMCMRHANRLPAPRRPGRPGRRWPRSSWRRPVRLGGPGRGHQALRTQPDHRRSPRASSSARAPCARPAAARNRSAWPPSNRATRPCASSRCSRTTRSCKREVVTQDGPAQGPARSARDGRDQRRHVDAQPRRCLCRAPLDGRLQRRAAGWRRPAPARRSGIDADGDARIGDVRAHVSVDPTGQDACPSRSIA